MTMENLTNNYTQNSGRHLQFSSKRKNDSDSNMLALDLSRKNHVTYTLPEVTKERTMELPQSLLANAKRYQQINLPGEDRQTANAGNSAMLSPYSEYSNSPKRMKTEDYYENNNQLKHFATFITPGVTMVSPQQPSLSVLPKEALKIPVAMPMSIPYMETSQSFMNIANNEASRKIVLTVPTEYSTSTDMSLPTTSLDTVKKASRPFKAYSKNCLSVAPIIDYNSNEEFLKFREMMLENVKKANGNTSNPKMRRVSKSPGLPTSTVDEKDAAYWERRKKNNEAAKRSRDARRAKEDELAIKAAYLEQQNAKLKYQLDRLYERYIYLYNLTH